MKELLEKAKDALSGAAGKAGEALSGAVERGKDALSGAAGGKGPFRKGPGNRKRISQEERNSIVLRQRILLGVLAALLLFYLVRTVHYAFHFEKKTFINGIEVSGLSLKKARAELVEHGAEGYSLLVKGPAGREARISGEAVSLKIEGAKHAKKCLREQNAFGWLFGNRREKNYEIELETSCDEAALSREIYALEMMDPGKMSKPVDARLNVAASGIYEIIPEDEGSTLREEEAAAAITDAVAKCRKTVDLTPCQVMPEIRSDDSNLMKRRDEWNALLSAAGLTYDVAENKIVFDAVKIGTLLDDNGETVTLSMEKIRDMVAEWKYDYDTYNHQFPFTTYHGNTVMIQPYGNYGYEIDDETLPEEMYNRILSGDRGSYEVPYYHKPPYNFNRGLGGNYVEVNTDLQHVWVWKDGEVVVDTEVVTGLPVYGRTTYHGCYAINLMDRNVVLGDVEVEGYEREVSYWVRFNGGEGLHDAPWRDSFGGRIWVYSGSHGCVNVPEWVMPDIYNNVELGEAVVVYGSYYDETVLTQGSGEVNTEYYEKLYDSGKLMY